VRSHGGGRSDADLYSSSYRWRGGLPEGGTALELRRWEARVELGEMYKSAERA
jgi:hypothetical protein